MREFVLSVEEQDDEMSELLDEGIIAFSRKTVSRPEPVWFQIVARDVDGKVQGGVDAKSHWDTVFIDTIWVDEGLRGSGLGRQLMDAAEKRSRAFGAKLIWLDTMSWQARPFYEKCGYYQFAELPYDGGKHAQYFMRKDL